MLNRILTAAGRLVAAFAVFAAAPRGQWLGALLLSLMTGCTTLDRSAHADSLAAPAGLKRELIHTGSFVLTAFSRISRAGEPLDLYIEGDGLAWISRREPSLDPTPREATGLALAAADPAANVAYLARPCQFTPMTMNPRCGVPYWTGKRFAPEVVASMNEAVDQFAARLPGQRINLVGYSGGGALAVLVAARRSDVASIRTVAGNLDDEFVNRLHQVSPMPASANPIDFAARVAAIPQIHFSGANDEVVPPEVAQRFVDAAGKRCAQGSDQGSAQGYAQECAQECAQGSAQGCAQARTVPGVAHEGDWGRLWPALLDVTPTCAGPPGINRETR